MAVPLYGFDGQVGREIAPDRRLGTEFSDHAKRHGAGGIFHTDELPAYGVTDEEVADLREAVGADPEDAVAIVADETPSRRPPSKPSSSAPRPHSRASPKPAVRTTTGRPATCVHSRRGADVPRDGRAAGRTRSERGTRTGTAHREGRTLPRRVRSRCGTGRTGRLRHVHAAVRRVRRRRYRSDPRGVDPRVHADGTPSGRRSGREPDRPTPERVLRMVEDGDLPNEGVGDLLAALADDPDRTPAEAADEAGLGGPTRMPCERRSSRSSSATRARSSRGMQAFSGLMGECMGHFAGKPTATS